MLSRLVQRRSVFVPTALGWLVLLLGIAGPLTVWWFAGESFLEQTERVPADALVVEGWIGMEGFRAAKLEFERGNYRYIVTTGAFAMFRTSENRWNFAQDARHRLIQLGVPERLIIEAPAPETPTGRTFQSALSLRQTLEAAGLHPAGLDVFTLAMHARRSRLVFAKVMKPETQVGVIAWRPADYSTGPWWRSSERSEELIKESVGWVFEFLLNSGRLSNSAGAPAPRPTASRPNARLRPL